jgi:acyl-CoA-binding protein
MPEILQFLGEVTGEKIVRLNPPAAETPRAAGTLTERFEAAVEKVRTAPPNGPINPSNEMKLKMYALFRQAKDGDAHGKRPGMMDVVGRFKYDAWAALKGLPREDAMRQYIDQIETLEKKFSAASGA